MPEILHQKWRLKKEVSRVLPVPLLTLGVGAKALPTALPYSTVHTYTLKTEIPLSSFFATKFIGHTKKHRHDTASQRPLTIADMERWLAPLAALAFATLPASSAFHHTADTHGSSLRAPASSAAFVANLHS